MSMDFDYVLTVAVSLVLWGAGGLIINRLLIDRPRRNRR